MIKFFTLLSFILSTTLHAVGEGYPAEKAEMVFEKTAVLKNNFCFPIVINVLNQTLDIPAASKHELKSQSWGPWNWMPGKRSAVQEKKVYYPLKNKTLVDFGPGIAPTHQNESYYAYDFSVPEKTPVYAMESGVVIRVIREFKSSHQDKTRMNENNTIEILHDDGTVGRYAHLYHEGIKVKHCQKVQAGEELALSGNTGFSSGPHLHVDIQKPTSGNAFITLPLNFLTSPP